MLREESSEGGLRSYVAVSCISSDKK